MVSDVFQIDWIFIDTVIIVLLFLLLIGVKIFKSTHRWRLSFSNEALEYYAFPEVIENNKNQLIKRKYSYLIKNCSRRKETSKLPLILILRTNFKKKLVNILNEGLCSYGFNVINIEIKIKRNKKYNLLNNIISEEMNSFIIKIINYFQNKNLITQSNFIMLNYYNSSFSYHRFLADVKNLGIILINPKVNIFNINHYQNLFDRSTPNHQLSIVFSKNSIFLFKNKNLKIFQRELKKRRTDKPKVIILEKANRSFKYYETLLLGIIIDLIEDNLNNYKN
ncbi:MAG: hypothetical protein ACFFB0_01105 [Promethearchaeota archaeon]